MKKLKPLLLMLGLTAIASTPVAPTGCATTFGVQSETKYGNIGINYTLPSRLPSDQGLKK